jgi:DNA uptake protein ComE-like DNA-binding protein
MVADPRQRASEWLPEGFEPAEAVSSRDPTDRPGDRAEPAPDHRQRSSEWLPEGFEPAEAVSSLDPTDRPRDRAPTAHEFQRAVEAIGGVATIGQPQVENEQWTPVALPDKALGPGDEERDARERVEQVPGPKSISELNRASFEQLCRLGLSVHQTARLIGQREQRGGFSSFDDLDGLRGLSADTVEVLKHVASA